jgi:hypothetical protein
VSLPVLCCGLSTSCGVDKVSDYTSTTLNSQMDGWLRPQVNHLGPYTLTRMLEPKLIPSKARVVNVVSVTHRLDKIRCAAAAAACLRRKASCLRRKASKHAALCPAQQHAPEHCCCHCVDVSSCSVAAVVRQCCGALRKPLHGCAAGHDW